MSKVKTLDMPTVEKTQSGGIGLTWVNGEQVMALEIRPDGYIEWFWRDRRSGDTAGTGEIPETLSSEYVEAMDVFSASVEYVEYVEPNANSSVDKKGASTGSQMHLLSAKPEGEREPQAHPRRQEEETEARCLTGRMKTV